MVQTPTEESAPLPKVPIPTLERLTRPVGRLVGVAAGAGIRDLERVGQGRAVKRERVTAHVDVGDRLLDFRHVTGDALAPRAATSVMRVVFHGGRMRSAR